MTDPDNAIICERRDKIAWIRLNKPKSLNALTIKMIDAFERTLAELEHDKTLCAVVVAGTERAFSAGADLKELQLRADKAGYESGPGSFVDRLNRFLCRLEEFPLPVIAAVRGWTMAGGLEIVLACDLVIAGESARFGDAHAKYGLLPGGGSSVRLPRKVGPMRAREMMFTGDSFSAADMKLAGLVTTVVHDGAVEEEAGKLALQLALRSPVGLRRMKSLLVYASEQPKA
ncbi:MAG: enoyl-CoA hydratase/isomerase family protein, partial [Afipia sp.]|nr:enoyl-CoA hydratase/isomerase family protein [Afipia sp.]